MRAKLPYRCFQRWMFAGILMVVVAYTLLTYSLSTPAVTAPVVQTSGRQSRQRAVNLADHIVPTESLLKMDNYVDLHHIGQNDDFLPYFAALHTIGNLSVAQAMATCDFTEEELTHHQMGQDSWWRTELRPNEEIDKVRAEWMTFMWNELIPWPDVSSHFDGRGIVIVTGHPKAVMRTKTILRALLAHGSTVPVEIHYYGDEMTDETKKNLRSIYDHPPNTRLYFNDLSGSDQIWQSTYNAEIHINFQLKTAALLNSRFAEPLLLDSDNVPAHDPASLWESKVYTEYGSVFWPDFSRTRAEHPAWSISNTHCRKDEYELESGQVMVDKRRTWYHLQLAAWMNTQNYWRGILLGDKDMFRFAWHNLKTEYGHPRKWITSLGFAAEQQSSEYPDSDDLSQAREGYCGHTFGQHHPDHTFEDAGSGISFLHGGTLKAMSAPLLASLRQRKGGIYTHYKQSHPFIHENWMGIEYRVGLSFWNVGWYYNHTPEVIVSPDEDFDKDRIPIGKRVEVLKLTDEDRKAAVLCTDWGAVEAKPLSDWGAEGEGFEKLFEQIGGYWMIEDGYRWGTSGA